MPSQKVRDMARDAIDALFNDNNYSEQASAPAPSLTVRMPALCLSTVHPGLICWAVLTVHHDC